MDPDDIIQIPGGPAIPRAWLDAVDEAAFCGGWFLRF
jgi:hypothetical protein